MTAEARPDESTDEKVMHTAIQSGDHEAIVRYRDAFPILEPSSDAAIQGGATPHNCSIALDRERGFEEPYHLNRCFSENIPVAPRETFEALKEAAKALEDADLHARCDSGHFDGERGTLMHVASNEHLPAMVEYLHRRGVPLDDLDDFGRSPAQFAVEGARLEALRALTGCGATLEVEATQLLDD